MNDLQELIDADPLDRTQPDVPSLIRAGRRIQVRRRAAAGTAGALAVAALAVAGATLPGWGTSGSPSIATDPSHSGTVHNGHKHNRPAYGPTTTPAATGASCPVDGIYICETPPAESRTPVGDVVPIGHDVNGDTEVVYAVRQPGFDLDTGKPETVVALKAGLLEGPDGLHGQGTGLQPGYDSAHVAPIPMSGGTQAGRYAILGDVPGSVGPITWTDADGVSHPVTGQSTMVVPGYTVFWLYGTDGAGPAYDFDTAVVHAGGDSCALADCAAQGAF
jgi:hypothetical protein